MREVVVKITEQEIALDEPGGDQLFNLRNGKSKLLKLCRNARSVLHVGFAM